MQGERLVGGEAYDVRRVLHRPEGVHVRSLLTSLDVLEVLRPRGPFLCIRLYAGCVGGCGRPGKNAFLSCRVAGLTIDWEQQKIVAANPQPHGKGRSVKHMPPKTPDERNPVDVRPQGEVPDARVAFWGDRGLSPLVTDYYQLTMMYAHFRRGTAGKRAVFDVFFRRTPCGNGYAIFAGLAQALEFLARLRFTREDLEELRRLGFTDEDFLRALAEFRFRGDVWAVPEGTVVFPYEPLLRVEATLFEAHLIETPLLSIVNHQTLIATKAARVVTAADGDPVLEFGLRRAHGPEAGVWGARAAYIGGVHSTSNVYAGTRFGIPVTGTHSHAFVQSFPSEREAFLAFLDAFPERAILLVDTYDTLRQGLPTAVEVLREHRERLGRSPEVYGVRLDSGDLAYLSKVARRMLDRAGLKDALVLASGDLSETIIRDLKLQGARIDAWGVGTDLITSADCPALGGVYKLSAVASDGGALEPVIKVSDNPEKITNPGRKQVWRFYHKRRGEAMADVIALDEEPVPSGPYEIFHPVYTHKRKILEDYEVRPLLEPVLRGGEVLAPPPSASEARRTAQEELARFSPEVRRLLNPHEYIVDLSLPLWTLKQNLLRQVSRPARPYAAEPYDQNGNGNSGSPPS
ncbi:nicotinate phosphoribosyltransferase [Brockia lithotrophica]|uniref:nicotinate phosphoribosyltransferase n=2 Tax=Brockia lithotrophica TaxID=933949 RepID=A0A660LB35_9BACL|nr:nicotinate phosphoribosyltransferase [Brockia lithotrophica]